MTVWYVLRIKDHSNVTPEYGAFGSKLELNNFLRTECSVFDSQIVYNKDGSVVYIKRVKLQ